MKEKRNSHSGRACLALRAEEEIENLKRRHYSRNGFSAWSEKSGKLKNNFQKVAILNKSLFRDLAAGTKKQAKKLQKLP